MTITDYTCAVALLILGVRFIITILEKFGWLEILQSRANSFFHKLLTCSFCRSFWAATILCLIIFLITGNWLVLTMPFFVASLGI